MLIYYFCTVSVVQPRKMQRHCLCSSPRSVLCRTAPFPHTAKVRTSGGRRVNFITYGRFNNNFCTVSVIEVLHMLENLTTLCLNEFHSEHKGHGCHVPSFWPLLLKKMSCLGATVAFKPHSHLLSVLLLLFCNFLLRRTYVIGQTLLKQWGEFGFYPGINCWKLLR